MDANLEFALRKTLGLQPTVSASGTAANRRNEPESFVSSPVSGGSEASTVQSRELTKDSASVFVDGMTLPPSPDTELLLHDFTVAKASDEAHAEDELRKTVRTSHEHYRNTRNRKNDWQAVDDRTYDYEQPVGYGETEQTAIDDLMQQFEEREGGEAYPDRESTENIRP